MVINKQNDQISISLDNGIYIAYGYIEDRPNTICINFNSKLPPSIKDSMVISNPGEYEMFGVIIKVSPFNNTFLSAEGIKITYAIDTKEILDDKNFNHGDIIIFDNNQDKVASLQDIVKIEKDIQPKLLIMNSSLDSNNTNSSEKVSKLKIKKNELDLIIDTKIYLI